MDREGAARTYHTFVYCGYFNRRMKQRMPDVDAGAGLSPLLSAIFAPAQPPASTGTGGATSAADRSRRSPTQASQQKHDEQSEAGPQSVESGYGEVSPVWRFFEQVGNAPICCNAIALHTLGRPVLC